MLLIRDWTRFPTILIFLIPLALVAFSEVRDTGTFYGAFSFAIFVFCVLPGWLVFLGRNKPGLKDPVEYGFSNSGVSTVRGPVSNFVDWSVATEASENREYITIRFKRGTAPVFLPKKQLQEAQLISLRELLNANLREKAKIRTHDGDAAP